MKDLALPRGQLVSKVLDEDSPSRCHASFHHLDCCQARHFIRCGLWSIYYKVLIQLHSSIMCFSLWGWFWVLHLDRVEEKTLRTVVIGHVNLSHGQGDLHSDICHCLSHWVCHCLCLFVIFGHGRGVLRSDILHSREPTSDSKARPHLTGSWKTRPRKLVPFKSWERFWLSSHKIEKGPRSSDLPLVERLLVDGELWKPVEEVQQSRLACNQGLQDHHLREIPAGNRC